MKAQFGYAISSGSDTYHLVDFASSCTLCGLPATPTDEVWSIELRVITEIPRPGRLCRHCDDAADAYSR